MGLGQSGRGLGQQALQRGVFITGTAQHQQVADRADHVLQGLVFTAGSGGSDYQFVVPGITTQQGGECTQCQALSGNPGTAGNGFHGLDLLGRELESMSGWCEDMNRCTWPV
ncbi:hypothetical protein PSCICP_39770 [Pseudomonas cichorii]|uniref:Uncharacterized protein n=1 Tax=Pseudomonas cichorii TaxID=36746 RepID=A0ABQ1DSJ7_PSECI|nr:hypothetical protein PSCICP_39770 [Pseudomonas cichorii]